MKYAHATIWVKSTDQHVHKIIRIITSGFRYCMSEDGEEWHTKNGHIANGPQPGWCLINYSGLVEIINGAPIVTAGLVSTQLTFVALTNASAFPKLTLGKLSHDLMRYDINQKNTINLPMSPLDRLRI